MGTHLVFSGGVVCLSAKKVAGESNICLGCAALVDVIEKIDNKPGIFIRLLT